MNSFSQFQVSSWLPADGSHIRTILEHVGWEENYIHAFEQAAAGFAGRDDAAVYMASQGAVVIGFIFVEVHAWNRLAQIQGLAVDPAWHRKGAGAMLVAQAENYARSHNARGIYVDTPTDNMRGRSFYEAIGYQMGYIMPRYYEDAIDGVTYQKFFDRVTGSE